MNDSERARSEALARLRGPLEANDAERVDFWRGRSDAEHAQAMIELSRYAEMVVGQTGYHKDPSDTFPGFPRPAAAPPTAERPG
jgi:hypothetical protein